MMGTSVVDIGLRDGMLATMPRSELGKLVRSKRRMLGWTQEELEARTGISQTTISEIEKGDTNRPQDATLRKLSAALDIPWRDVKVALGDVLEVTTGEESTIRVRGRVPADTVRWVAFEQEGRTVDIPTRWVDAARFPLFAVEVSGDCLLGRGIVDNDVVVCEEFHEQPIRDGAIVLIRFEDEYTLKAWHAVTATEIELRDGAGSVVKRFSRTADFQVIGIARHRHGDL